LGKKKRLIYLFRGVFTTESVITSKIPCHKCGGDGKAGFYYCNLMISSTAIESPYKCLNCEGKGYIQIKGTNQKMEVGCIQSLTSN